MCICNNINKCMSCIWKENCPNRNDFNSIPKYLNMPNIFNFND